MFSHLCIVQCQLCVVLTRETIVSQQFRRVTAYEDPGEHESYSFSRVLEIEREKTIPKGSGEMNEWTNEWTVSPSLSPPEWIHLLRFLRHARSRPTTRRHAPPSFFFLFIFIISRTSSISLSALSTRLARPFKKSH